MVSGNPVTACLVFPINTRAQDSVQNLIERGNELFNDGDFEGAVESYGKAPIRIKFSSYLRFPEFSAFFFLYPENSSLVKHVK